jgi:hypothetical protein
LIKKFELCENLAKKERTKDGYGLLVDDGGYTNITHVDPSHYLKEKHSDPVENAINHIIESRSGFN